MSHFFPFLFSFRINMPIPTFASLNLRGKLFLLLQFRQLFCQ